MAEFAQGRLTRRGHRFESGFSLAGRIEAAGIEDLNALDALIDAERAIVRESFDVATLEQANWIVSALERARKELLMREASNAAPPAQRSPRP